MTVAVMLFDFDVPGMSHCSYDSGSHVMFDFYVPGMRRCGPAPLAAIKEGQTYIPYDSGFVFSEVNGEKINWLVRHSH